MEPDIAVLKIICADKFQIKVIRHGLTNQAMTVSFEEAKKLSELLTNRLERYLESRKVLDETPK